MPTPQEVKPTKEQIEAYRLWLVRRHCEEHSCGRQFTLAESDAVELDRR